MSTRIVLPIVVILLWIIQGIVSFFAGVSYNNKYDWHWDMADRSSTIQDKRKHLGNFVDALERGNEGREFAANSAMIRQTPQTDFTNNFEALKTLVTRLDSIQNMDPNSFEYNTALQQITAQEQGEASAMLAVFQDAYVKACYPLATGWAWTLTLVLGLLIILCCVPWTEMY